MTPSPTDRLASIRSSLIEAKRYVLSDPDGCHRMLYAAVSDLVQAAHGPECRAAGYPDATRILLSDCALGLCGAARCLLADPEVATAYLTVAIHEMGALRSEIEKEAASEGRDAELAEAYGKKGR